MTARPTVGGTTKTVHALTHEGPPSFRISEIRPLAPSGELQVLCGISFIEEDDEPSDYCGSIGVYTDPYVVEQIYHALWLHCQTDNYEPTTTRVLAIPVGQGYVGTLVQYGEDGQCSLIGEIELHLPLIEFSGDNADPTERTKYDDSILMYSPPGYSSDD